jgi:hypothetical protein
MPDEVIGGRRMRQGGGGARALPLFSGGAVAAAFKADDCGDAAFSSNSA